MTAKALTEGIRRAGTDVNRESLHQALSGLGRNDVSGLVIDFKPGLHPGGKLVDIAVIHRNGNLRYQASHSSIGAGFRTLSAWEARQCLRFDFDLFRRPSASRTAAPATWCPRRET